MSSSWSSRSARATSSELKATPKRRPSSPELRPTPKARPTAELKPTLKAKVSSSSWTQASKADRSKSEKSKSTATPPWRQASASGRNHSQAKANATSSKRGNYADDSDKEEEGYWQQDNKKERKGYWQEDNENEDKGYWQEDNENEDAGYWQEDNEKGKKGYWQHGTREKDKGFWQDDNEKEDKGYWQDWKPKATYSWAKKSEKKLLPIQEKRAEVIPVICGTSRVVTLLGETGSGKSTQVPQMILAQARAANLTARVCVTQPRRVAALNLANRVATELGEYVGESVGYRIGGESKPGYNIDFCTVGYTLQLFLNSPEEFGNYTHIILDEVHERSAESDMLCLVVRLLAQHRFKHMRLVVMSATLQSDLFARYFAPISPEHPVGHVFVGARCFTVTQHFLEELPKALGKKLRCESLIMSKIKDVFGAVKPKKIDQKHCDKLHKIILELLEIIAVKGSTILVFLPGIAEISSLWQEAKEMDGNGFRIFPLHSMVPREEQELVFQEPDPDVTNVVLATDIAESSITLPHVVAVIDLGLHRRVDHDASKGIASLATKWISKAAAAQRSGRAGRTQPGLCLRLYTKEFFEKHMKEFEPPECTSMALDRLYLQAKQLSCQLAKSLEGLQVPRGAQELLAQLPEAPDLKNVVAARQKNAELGTISNATEVAKITPLGYLCLQLPLDLKLTRLVWLGAHFGLAADAVVLASVITSQDAFSMPSPLFMWEESEFVSRLRSAASARILFDGGELSEPLMQRQLFLEWLTDFHHNEYVCGDKERVLWARRRHTLSFSHQYSLSRGRMEHVVSYVVDLSLRTYRACMPDSMAAKSLSELLFALGYTIQRGDLSGIPGKEWRAFHPEEQAFETNTSYLKALLAAAFSDQLLLGGYGSVAKEIDTSGKSGRKQLEQLEALQKLMEKHDCPARETVLFAKDVKDPHEYVEHVSGNGGRNVEKEETHTLVRLSLDAQSEGGRWCALASRKSAPLLVSKTRLPAEFNLLSQFQKHMQELQRVQATGWTYRPVPFIHPHILRWEWMEPLYTPKGALQRCEGMLEKKNPVGLVGYVQPLEEGKLKPVACFAVAANVRGGQGPTNCYPESVTCLSPGHIGFILSTTKLDLTKTQLRRFGFTTRGELAVLHRCVDLPSGCLYGAAWERVRLLRQALFNELQFDMPSKDTPVLYDSNVEGLARELFESMPKASEEAQLSLDRDCSLNFLSNTTVNLSKEELPLGVVHEAFLPLAEWSTLVERRQALVNKINSQAKANAKAKEAKEAKEAKRHPTEAVPAGRADAGRSPRRAPRVVSPRRRSRSRRRRGVSAPRVVSPRRSRSRRSRKRHFTEAPRATQREDKGPKKPKKLKASECQLYDLVLQVLDRWRSACDDEVGDDRFKAALDVVLSSGALRREEVERVRPLLDRQMQLPPPRQRGRGSLRDLRVPTALAELEKRNKDILRVSSRASSTRPREETQAPASAAAVAIPPVVTAAEPAAEPEPTEEAAEAPEAAEAEVEVVDLEDGERSPGSPAEVPGLAPFTPSPNGESDEP